MSRRLALLTWSLVLATAGTGLLQAWMRYVVEASDPFSAYNHPWQGTTEALHALFGPLAALGLGIVLAAHAKPKWSSPAAHWAARRSGAFVVGLLLVLVVTGAWLNAWPPVDGKLLNWTHGIVGTSFALAVVGHSWSSRRAKRAKSQ
jgi:hypothetical protein